MAGVYRPRHPERTVLYRVLFHYFERFLAEYEIRFEKEYGFLRINFHPHLHFLATEGGMDEMGIFHMIPRLDDARLAELFAREVLGFLVGREMLSPEWAERLLSWRHTGFNVHSLVRAKTKLEAERVGKYMIRPVLSLERLLLMEPEGKVGYRHGQQRAELETMDYLEFIARVTSHIPDKGQVMVRYYGLYANAHRGKVKKASLVPVALGIVEEELRSIPSKGWAALIRKPHIGLRSAALMNRSRFMRTAKRGHDPQSLRGRPDDLPQVRGDDEGHLLPHRVCRRGQDYRLPAVDLCRG